MKRRGRALTPEQVNALPDAELISRVDPTVREMIVSTNRGAFEKQPEKLPTESTGVYRRRVRASKQIDESEFLNAVRRDLRAVILQEEKSQRWLDKMTESIDPAESQARSERLAAKERRLAQESDLSISGTVPTAQWENERPTRPNPLRAKGKK